MTKSLSCLLMAACLLAGCDTATRTADPVLAVNTRPAPPQVADGTCWDKTVAPAIVETVTEQILQRPAELAADGSVVTPAVYTTVTRQAIVQERREAWFETPCADILTPAFIETLQRALAARGHYRGPVTGEMDARTRTAIRRYQEPLGLKSSTLSLAAARKMGLISVTRP